MDTDYSNLYIYVAKQDNVTQDISNTKISLAYFFPYYEPSKTFSKGGEISWSSTSYNMPMYYDFERNLTYEIKHAVYRTYNRVYDYLLFDLSAFSWLTDGNAFTTY